MVPHWLHRSGKVRPAKTNQANNHKPPVKIEMIACKMWFVVSFTVNTWRRHIGH